MSGQDGRLLCDSARYYDTTLGRFTQADSIVSNLYNPQSLNRYAYVLNNPIRYSDPSGHVEEEEAGGAGGGGAEEHEEHPAEEIVVTPETADQYYQPSAESDGDQTPSGESQEKLHDELADALANPDIAEAPSKAWVEIFAKGYDPTKDTRFTGFDEFDQGNISLTFALYRLQVLQDEGKRPNLDEMMVLLVLGGIVASNGNRSSVPEYNVPGTPCSFAKDTGVITANGLVPIQLVKVGDLVLAYDANSGKVGYFPVTGVFAHSDSIIEFVTIDGETILTTPRHPFFTNHQGWVEAGSLSKNARIRDLNGNFGNVSEIRIVRQTRTMYDLSVLSVHNFFVGTQHWLVHNCPPSPYGSWKGQGGWHSMNDAEGNSWRVRQLSSKDVNKLGLEESKAIQGYPPKAALYGTNEGDLFIKVGNGPLEPFSK